MTTFPSVTGRELISALAATGFVVARVKGSHHFLWHADGPTTVVPVHSGETIRPGLPSKIFRGRELSREVMQKLL